jgi:hypothetical protein
MSSIARVSDAHVSLVNKVKDFAELLDKGDIVGIKGVVCKTIRDCFPEPGFSLDFEL